MMWFSILDEAPVTTLFLCGHWSLSSSVVFPLPSSLLLPSLLSSLFSSQSDAPDSCRVSQRLLEDSSLFHLRFRLLSLSANEEGARGCHGNPEEAQRHGPQHRGCQGRNATSRFSSSAFEAGYFLKRLVNVTGKAQIPGMFWFWEHERG